MTVRTGLGSGVMMSEEITWGTAVARTNSIRATALSLMREVTTVEVENLGDLAATVEAVRESFISTDYVGGGFTINAAYNDSTLMLAGHAIGDVATSGAGPYTHLYTLLDPTKPGLTLEGLWGSGAQAQVFAGCRVATSEFSIEKNGQAKWEYTFIGKNSAGMVSAGSPTLNTSTSYLFHHHMGAVSFNSVNYTPKSFSVAIDNKLERNPCLGTAESAEPFRSGPVEITVTMVVNYDADALHAAYLAGTISNVAVTFTDPLDADNTLTITVHACKIVKLDQPISSRNIIEQTIEFKGFSTAANKGVSFSFTNGNALATAN